MTNITTIRNRLVTFSAIQQVCDGTSAVIFNNCRDTHVYKDKKPTDAFESTTIICCSKILGDIKLVFPYTPGLAEKINGQIEFGDRFAITEICRVEDVSVGIYKEELTFKFFCQTLEN